MSRTLQGLSLREAQPIGAVLDRFSQPFIDETVVAAMRTQGRLIYDGDLTGRPVSPTSTTYPGAAYGHMDDAVQLGYQAAVVSLQSAIDGQLWLSVELHPVRKSKRWWLPQNGGLVYAHGAAPNS